MKLMSRNMKHKISKQSVNTIKVISGISALVALILAGIKLTPVLMALINDKSSFEAKISEMGFSGWLCILCIQILQIIIAVIPGEPIELVSGMLYGTFGGFVTCEIGILIGSAAIFYGVRFFGYSLVSSFIGDEKLSTYKFLHNTKRLELITFILFFIPGTPKDILTYVVGFTPIKPLRFFTIAVLARVPSVLSSTFAGATFTSGNITATLIIFAVTGAIALIGILIHRKLMQKLK
ncbi:MAG: VTT domain-containing protein [Oscillospiraceae bacterium]